MKNPLSFLHQPALLQKAVLSYKFITFLVLLSGSISATAQSCTYVNGIGCPGTNYNNSFMNSTTDAATIEYDNWVSTFHSTMVRRTDGQFMVWGEMMASDGVSPVLSPRLLDSINYPALGSNKVLKVTGASQFVNQVQFIALATDGLYAWGEEGRVIDASLTTGTGFQKLTSLNGNGLPPGVNPTDVKMMTASYWNLCILTCSGDLWMLSKDYYMRGDFTAFSSTTWYRVRTNASGRPPLANIVAVRTSAHIAIALRSDNTIWTWGGNTLLGNNTPETVNPNAVQMINPAAGPIKMIGAASLTNHSYYVLMANSALYSMGNNVVGQLGDWTTVYKTAWVQPRYDSAIGPVMNNIHWFSVNDHDASVPAVNVLTSAGTLYSFGQNSRYQIGHTDPFALPHNPTIPNGVTAADVITGVSTGGHTSMMAKCNSTNFGYVGHRINGSMGNGSNADVDESSYTFLTAAVPICGISLAEIKASPGVIPQYGTVYHVSQTVPILTYPAGGTLSIQSGPGVLTGNMLSFSHAGIVVLNYTYVNVIGTFSCTTTAQLTLTAVAGILPLKLLNFTARSTDCYTELNWETADEQNTSHFEIQQSEDGRTWKTAGNLAAQGTGSGRKYNYKTAQDVAVMFYRLKMVDINGVFVYSNVVVSQNKCKSTNPVVQLSPNPAQGADNVAVNIYGTYRGKIKFTVISTLGAQVFTKEILLNGNPVTERLNIRSLASGVYIVRLTDEKGVLLGEAQKLLK